MRGDESVAMGHRALPAVDAATNHQAPTINYPLPTINYQLPPTTSFEKIDTCGGVGILIEYVCNEV